MYTTSCGFPADFRFPVDFCIRVVVQEIRNKSKKVDFGLMHGTRSLQWQYIVCMLVTVCMGRAWLNTNCTILKIVLS